MILAIMIPLRKNCATIEQNSAHIVVMGELSMKYAINTLSYAYYDKGLTQALFYYFWLRSGFLYVNWMWDGANNHSSATKKKLEYALKDSNQFLFLRTTNSELRIRGNNNSIRQWCAWEIGNFYTKHKEEKYYTSFYDKTEPRNDILDTFRPMREVVLGEIR